jgi:cytochrome c peroxidase
MKDFRWIRSYGMLARVAKRGARHWVFVVGFLGLAAAVSAAFIPNLFPFLDRTGVVSTYNVSGRIDESNPFFQSLGTNGRTCATCHVAANAFGLSAEDVRERFSSTDGSDPLFATFDGANCPNFVSGDRGAHSLLLRHGLIRIGLAVPANAQYTISAVSDPYGCALVTDPTTGQQTASVYRRPLPTTNLGFLSTVMFDGRETILPLNNSATFHANLVTDLMHQAVDATTGHAQATTPPTVEQQTAIVDFELGLFSAQVFDNQAGSLSADGAQGGPVSVSQQAYYPGINDSLGGDPNGNAFNPTVFTLFAPWANSPAGEDQFSGARAEVRRHIAAGEVIFNSHPLTISNVRGLNDNSALAKTLGTSVPIPPFQGFCTSCHDTPNVGNHSLPLPLDIGTGHDMAKESDPLIANAVSQLSFPDVPVFEITGCPDPFAAPGQQAAPYTFYTTDPGTGLITGLCSDVNRTKGPILRGLAARAPYFHNGAARNLRELVEFYNQRFQMNLTEGEKSDLIAFLNSL